ncbi:MAG: hypothetical protein ABT05_03250 [Lautropia sp. SCN 66-9]|nr:MAG: hypothetical protein ABT05_03250 [Lautropia sp. SCN 66-9]
MALGDEILGKGRLDPQDHAPYQQLNIDIHNTILAASSNAWVSRFAAQAHHIPYASDRIMLWESHQVIWRSHDDHHRIVRALRSRDGRRAEELMREHVYYAGVILRDNYSKLLEKQAAAE